MAPHTFQCDGVIESFQGRRSDWLWVNKFFFIYHCGFGTLKKPHFRSEHLANKEKNPPGHQIELSAHLSSPPNRTRFEYRHSIWSEMRDALAVMPAIPSSSSATTRSATGDVIYPLSANDDIEKQHCSTSSDDVIHGHVDIQYAERQFADLKRRYSNLSRVESVNSQRSRARGPGTADSETEKGGTAEEIEEDEFDLEDVLRDRHRKEVEHDIKPKHLGILSDK